MVAHRRDRPEAIIAEAARPLSGSSRDYDELLELIGDARFVLVGEASHGTHEFYLERARITRRLVEEKGFTAVCVEADWPDAYRVNRFVRGCGDDPDALSALEDFERFPAWMWRNQDVLEFVEWLAEHNSHRPKGSPRQVGFYGLDLYSLHSSIRAVISYLETVDKEAAGRARARYACFEHFGEDPQAYGFAASYRIDRSCEDEVVRQLDDLRNRAVEYAKRDGKVAEDEYFFAEQNARLALNAERYYRTMFSGRVSSWNLRDTHMAETLEDLVAHLGRHGEEPRAVVWAHNSHLGDARATEMGRQGELNLGQLVRQRYGELSFSIGFTTSAGTVTAADDWDEPPRRMTVRPALDGSFEHLFHGVGIPRFWLDLRSGGAAAEGLRRERLERAIGVVYRPRTERASHYFHARLSDQFDAVIHLDETSALMPLDRARGLARGRDPRDLSHRSLTRPMKAVVFHGVGDIRLDRVVRPEDQGADRRDRPPHGQRDLRDRPPLRPRHRAGRRAGDDPRPRGRGGRRGDGQGRPQLQGRRPRRDRLDHRLRLLLVLSRGLSRAVRQRESQRLARRHVVLRRAEDDRPVPGPPGRAGADPVRERRHGQAARRGDGRPGDPDLRHLPDRVLRRRHRRDRARR